MLYHTLAHRRCTQDIRRFGGLSLWLSFRCLPAILLGGLVLLLLAVGPAHAAAQLSEGRPDLRELASGQLLLQDRDNGHYVPAIIHASKVHFDISGMVATVRVEQSFRNDGSSYLEGVYAFPLPDNAAVRSLEMIVGERRIVGKIREKVAAKKLFEAARKAGKKASLVEQHRPNMFSNRVANIGPGEVVTVRLEYVQQVAFDAAVFSLRFPTTITPRYMPGQSTLSTAVAEEGKTLQLNPLLGWAHPTDEVPDANAISPLLHPSPGSEQAPLNAITITARLDMGMPLASVVSPYHDIALSRRAGVYSISLVNDVSEMDRDFMLAWQPVTGTTPQAALFTEKVEDEYYGLLMMVPPAMARQSASIGREIIFVVDTSGSMGGVSMEQARASVSRALQQLQPQERFNIIEFNSAHTTLFRRAMPATRHHVQQALEFVRQLRASGGTEMLPALRAALVQSREVDMPTERAALRQVIFITDGAVGNEKALFEQMSLLIGDSRMFTVGIGSAPNSWFMRKAAQYGRGTHTHISDLSEVTQKMDALFEQLAHPAVVDLAVTWPGAVEAWPERLPDLYRGQPLALTVNLGKVPPSGEIRVSGEIDGQVWQERIQLGDGADQDLQAAHEGVASLWARNKIEGLLDNLVTGADPESVRADVLSIALRHQLLSPYTSFVAVEEAVFRPEGSGMGRTAVPNTRPRGQSVQSFAYPRTATTGPAKVWLGLLALFGATLLRLLRQPEVDHVPARQDV